MPKRSLHPIQTSSPAFCSAKPGRLRPPLQIRILLVRAASAVPLASSLSARPRKPGVGQGHEPYGDEQHCTYPSLTSFSKGSTLTTCYLLPATPLPSHPQHGLYFGGCSDRNGSIDWRTGGEHSVSHRASRFKYRDRTAVGLTSIIVIPRSRRQQSNRKFHLAVCPLASSSSSSCQASLPTPSSSWLGVL